MLSLILLFASLVCFLLAAFGALTRIGVGWLGAALVTLTLIVEQWPGK